MVVSIRDISIGVVCWVCSFGCTLFPQKIATALFSGTPWLLTAAMGVLVTPLKTCSAWKNYLPDCMTGEDEGKSDYFQCAVHLPVDKWNWHNNFLNLSIKGVLMFSVAWKGDGYMWIFLPERVDTFVGWRRYVNFIDLRGGYIILHRQVWVPPAWH